MPEERKFVNSLKYFEKSIAEIKINCTFAIPNQNDSRYENKFSNGTRLFRLYA